MAQRGLVIAGLSSGSGKTTITLGLLRALTRQHSSVPPIIGAAKTGPDYIDCAFLGAACNATAINLDSYAMPPETLCDLASSHPCETLIIEGVMGLFDGTAGGRGSTAELAQTLGLPVILVIDARHQAQTAAAIAAGLGAQLSRTGSNCHLAGVILNRVASPRHLTLIADALTQHNIRLFGHLPPCPDITVPSRHLGLVQAGDLAATGDLERIIDTAADLMEAHIDCAAIFAAAGPLPQNGAENDRVAHLPAPGQNIATAYDPAFGFAYTHMLDQWREAGATIHNFSPLNDEAPTPTADFIFLPGGYPELHLPILSSAQNFKSGMQQAALRATPIYGECGGYMTLGQRIIDADGEAFEMLGLLDLETSFAKRKLHLGYRQLVPTGNASWPPHRTTPLIGHEFHYTQAIRESGTPLFTARDAFDRELGSIGLVQGSVFGSYAHLIG